MRITNRMITTKYTRSLNVLSYDLDKLNTKMTTGRAFMKSSENTSAAIKAFQLRRDLSKSEGYKSNIEHAQSTLTNTESALNHVQELVETAKERILAGVNGTMSDSERKVVAKELRSIQDQFLQTMNSTASDVYYFGGSNTDKAPFTASNGKLSYNGQDLDTLTTAQATALSKDSLFVDIGVGVKFDGSGNIDRNSVFNYSTPGISITGSGTSTVDGEVVSNNIYNIIGDIATEFESSHFLADKANSLYGHLRKQSENIIYGITELGAKTAYLDFMKDRLETQTLDNETRQLSVEGADPARTIIDFKSQQVAYEAALQMGTRVIQPSIFDFMS